ncbi:hypothetical protein Glove_73g30 [Diversispora epigaea]|uniref:Uncharacterized protein n=1 Tax=Diversispora epigaea TaxID=1348612 RepID=A0A397JIQ0_9GLOM|nr:hypothetical protein Glove_73g30 [Diversispora epigaea]
MDEESTTVTVSMDEDQKSTRSMDDGKDADVCLLKKETESNSFLIEENTAIIATPVDLSFKKSYKKTKF